MFGEICIRFRCLNILSPLLLGGAFFLRARASYLWLDNLPPYPRFKVGPIFFCILRRGSLASTLTGIANSGEYSSLSITNPSSTPMNFAYNRTSPTDTTPSWPSLKRNKLLLLQGSLFFLRPQIYSHPLTRWSRRHRHYFKSSLVRNIAGVKPFVYTETPSPNLRLHGSKLRIAIANSVNTLPEHFSQVINLSSLFASPYNIGFVMPRGVYE